MDISKKRKRDEVHSMIPSTNDGASVSTTTTEVPDVVNQPVADPVLSSSEQILTKIGQSPPKKDLNLINNAAAGDGSRDEIESLFDLYHVTENHLKGVKQILLKKKMKVTRQTVENVAEFFLFSAERQHIWAKKNAGLDYRSAIGILNRYKFCNVYRELDRGTQYFHAQVNILRREHAGSTARDLLARILWSAAVYRQVNRVETFVEFGRIPRWEDRGEFMTFLQHMREDKKVIFTGQHQTTSLQKLGVSLEQMEEGILEIADHILGAGRLGDILNELKGIPGISDFFGWQVLCDLLESRILRYSEEEWAMLGPGAKKGILICFPGSPKTKQGALSFAKVLRDIQGDVFEEMGVKFPKFNGLGITLKNIEHTLCEFCKYTNKKNNTHAKLSIFQSRAPSLDCEKPCAVCDRPEEEGIFCDGCNEFFCADCTPTAKHAVHAQWWFCDHCHKRLN